MKAKTALKAFSRRDAGRRMIAVPYISCAAALLFPLCAAAQTQRDGVQRAARATADSLNGTLDLASSQGKTIHLPAPAASIFVADPAIADYQAPSNTTIFVFGKSRGEPACLL